MGRERERMRERVSSPDKHTTVRTCGKNGRCAVDK